MARIEIQAELASGKQTVLDGSIDRTLHKLGDLRHALLMWAHDTKVATSPYADAAKEALKMPDPRFRLVTGARTKLINGYYRFDAEVTELRVSAITNAGNAILTIFLTR